MYAICSTKKDDVKNAVQAMVDEGHDFPIVQTNLSTYRKLEANQIALVPNFCKKHKASHKVDKNTQILHTNKCKKVHNPTWDARIIDPKATGLTLCTCVKRMRKK